MPSERRARTLFRGLNIAIGDTFKCDMKRVDMEDAIRRHGGRFTLKVTDETTHLITTDRDYDRRSDIVKAALCKGGYKVPIIEGQWLIDCLNKTKILPVKLYRLEKKKARLEHETLAKEEATAAAEKARREAEFINWTLNNIYTDATGFKYKVQITRDISDFEEEGNESEHAIAVNQGGDSEEKKKEILTLYLAESKERNPKLYTFGYEYQKRKGGKKYKHRPSLAGGVFQNELNSFQHFFKRKCGISWDERLARVGVMKPLGFYQYQPPSKEGAPLGVIENDHNIPEQYHDAVMAQREIAAEKNMRDEIDALFDD